MDSCGCYSQTRTADPGSTGWCSATAARPIALGSLVLSKGPHLLPALRSTSLEPGHPRLSAKRPSPATIPSKGAPARRISKSGHHVAQQSAEVHAPLWIPQQPRIWRVRQRGQQHQGLQPPLETPLQESGDIQLHDQSAVHVTGGRVRECANVSQEGASEGMRERCYTSSGVPGRRDLCHKWDASAIGDFRPGDVSRPKPPRGVNLSPPALFSSSSTASLEDTGRSGSRQLHGLGHSRGTRIL